MTDNKIIDGKSIADNIRAEIATHTKALGAMNVIAGLAVIQVGDNPNSMIYVANKIKAAKEVGIHSFVFKLDEPTTTKHLKVKIEHLNNDPKIHGILVQLPLPSYVNTQEVLNTISPAKDVDGVTTENIGRLVTKQDGLVPCTPQGCLILLKSVIPDLTGLDAVVIGRSNIVGRPMSNILINENCTVTLTHSYTKNIEEICRQADIIVVAIGVPKLIKSSWIKPGAVVIDVGINRINNMLIGDVDFAEILTKVRAITPVPKGVGPMTIACLLKNTIKATMQQRSLVFDKTGAIVRKDKFRLSGV